MAAPAMKLYEATDALDVVRDWIFEHDEEIRAAEGALPDELAALLDQAEGDFRTKAERVGLFIRELVANSKAVKEEADRLAARAKHYDKAGEGLKRYLQIHMELADIPKIEGKLVTVRLQKSPPSIVGVASQDDLAKLDGGFTLFAPATFRLDGRAYIEAWKRGEAPEIPGVGVTQSQHLRIS